MLYEFDFSFEKFTAIIPSATLGSEIWYNELYEIFPTFDITTTQRVAAFLGQTSHESGGYKLFKENLNYSAEGLCKTWPKRFPTLEYAKQFARHPNKIANVVYANRMGNGGPETGDGWRYCGRGLIQLTGKTNYSLFAEYAGITPEDASEYLETPRGAVHSACWYWYTNDLNALADVENHREITRRINGGFNGLEDRIKKTQYAQRILESS